MHNKVVVVTGASQGLGKELSLQLAKLGAKIALVARTEKLLAEVKSQIELDGGVAQYFVCDVTNFNQVNSTVTKIIETFGTIDVLINNAGVWISNEIGQNDPSRIDSAFQINSIAPIHFSQSVLSLFEKQQSGHFVFINSVAGLAYPENKDWLFYSATKWALTGYTKALSSRLSGTPIKVSSFHPGPFTTNIDKNAGDNFGDDHSSEMTVSQVAKAVVDMVNAPGKLQIDTIELKNTNWNQ